MNIIEIKAFINANEGTTISNLEMSTQLDADKKPTEWVTYWDNTKRLRVVLHKDLYSAIKTNPAMSGLGLKKEQVVATATVKAYTRYVIVQYSNVIGSL